MKYLKTYEDLINIGEYVKCINDYNFQRYITKNNIYKVLNKMKNTSSSPSIFLEDDNGKKNWWSEFRFIKATPKEIKEYKIKIDTNKYNL